MCAVFFCDLTFLIWKKSDLKFRNLGSKSRSGRRLFCWTFRKFCFKFALEKRRFFRWQYMLRMESVLCFIAIILASRVSRKPYEMRRQSALSLEVGEDLVFIEYHLRVFPTLKISTCIILISCNMGKIPQSYGIFFLWKSLTCATFWKTRVSE